MLESSDVSKILLLNRKKCVLKNVFGFSESEEYLDKKIYLNNLKIWR